MSRSPILSEMLIYGNIDCIVGVLVLTPGFCCADDALILTDNIYEMKLKVEILEWFREECMGLKLQSLD